MKSAEFEIEDSACPVVAFEAPFVAEPVSEERCQDRVFDAGVPTCSPSESFYSKKSI